MITVQVVFKSNLLPDFEYVTSDLSKATLLSAQHTYFAQSRLVGE